MAAIMSAILLFMLLRMAAISRVISRANQGMGVYGLPAETPRGMRDRRWRHRSCRFPSIGGNPHAPQQGRRSVSAHVQSRLHGEEMPCGELAYRFPIPHVLNRAVSELGDSLQPAQGVNDCFGCGEERVH